MNAPLPSDLPTDLLAEAINIVRPRLSRSAPIGQRLRTLWAAVFAARDLGAVDVVAEEFTALARETGMAADLGRYADETLDHVITWAVRGDNPFD